MSLKDHRPCTATVSREKHTIPQSTASQHSLFHGMMCKSHVVKENVMCERLVIVTSSPATSTLIRTGRNKTHKFQRDMMGWKTTTDDLQSSDPYFNWTICRYSWTRFRHAPTKNSSGPDWGVIYNGWLTQKRWPALSCVLWLQVCLAVLLNLPSVVRHSIPPKTTVPRPVAPLNLLCLSSVVRRSIPPKTTVPRQVVPLNLPSVVRHSIPPKASVPGPGVLRETMGPFTLQARLALFGSAAFPLPQPSHCPSPFPSHYAGPAASTSVVRTRLDAVFYPAEQQMPGTGRQAVLNSAPEPCHVWLTSILGWPCKCNILSSAWKCSLL